MCGRNTFVDAFPAEKIFVMDATPWYADFVNYLMCGKTPFGVTGHKKARFLRDATKYQHKALWTLKQVNMDYEAAEKKRLLDITELEETRHNAYENAFIYKDKSKRWHDKIILQ
ncbi:hypothetical protein HRI_003230700 [Hibiscus trionum]|uniref:Uncharacterized protein n=1 Tax=Hibiscus trionum TaxID=183268 RepID=A0A9W7MCV3_HIBTR|nr:hypothetical protein HRI_003230700 [Hibiscus trionum]